jgi:hypothetical protein
MMPHLAPIYLLLWPWAIEVLYNGNTYLVPMNASTLVDENISKSQFCHKDDRSDRGSLRSSKLAQDSRANGEVRKARTGEGVEVAMEDKATIVKRRYGKWETLLPDHLELSNALHRHGAEALKPFGYEPRTEFHYATRNNKFSCDEFVECSSE